MKTTTGILILIGKLYKYILTATIRNGSKGLNAGKRASRLLQLKVIPYLISKNYPRNFPIISCRIFAAKGLGSDEK